MSKTKITPKGNKILVLPISTDGLAVAKEGIMTVQNDLSKANVVEVGDMGDIYKVGDTVLYPSGVGLTQMYKGKPHLWLTGTAYPNQGDVWGVITNDK